MTSAEIDELLALAEAPFGRFRLEHLRALVDELHRRGAEIEHLRELVSARG